MSYITYILWSICVPEVDVSMVTNTRDMDGFARINRRKTANANWNANQESKNCGAWNDVVLNSWIMNAHTKNWLDR